MTFFPGDWLFDEMPAVRRREERQRRERRNRMAAGG